MLRWILLVLCACDTAPTTQVPPGPTPPGSLTPPVTPPPATSSSLDLQGPWTAVAACGSARLLATNNIAFLAVEVRDSVIGESLTTGVAVTDFAVAGWVVAFEGPASYGDICGSIEEFPPFGDASWNAYDAPLSLDFVPDRAFTLEQIIDDPFMELGTLTLRLDTMVLEPRQGIEPQDLAPSDLPGVELSARLNLLDIPA